MPLRNSNTKYMKNFWYGLVACGITVAIVFIVASFMLKYLPLLIAGLVLALASAIVYTHLNDRY